ncbi:MAG: ATP-dependent DNA ligase [Actinomycetota bacterium]
MSRARATLGDLAGSWTAVAGASARLEKIRLLAALLSRIRPDDAETAVAYLSGFLPQGKIGVGWAALRDLPPPAAGPPALTVAKVDAILRRIQSTTGPGSVAKRREMIHDLFGRATDEERRFLLGLLSGELRQGALEGVMIEAVARASGVPAPTVRRARMLAGELGPVARAALESGAGRLGAYGLELLRPIQPMLAKTADSLADAVERLAPASVEWKLDGVRVQVHRLGDEVRAYTRNLADVTGRLPELVREVLALRCRSVILDGEAIALLDGGRPRAFQESMSRFGSRTRVETHRARTPLSAAYFDCLHLDGEDLIDRPVRERHEALDRVVPRELRVPRVVCNEAEQAQAVLDDALAAGHEGVMVKSLQSPYEAGRRGAGWLKVKPAKTLDLVVLAAEWGHGRRQGRLSNLHLGARHRESPGGFAMLGKTFKGMTDEMLAWQTEHLLGLETHRDGITVHVRPQLVVEVAFDGVQRSTRYPSGMALRFARIKGYRHDKGPEDADTIETVRASRGG